MPQVDAGELSDDRPMTPFGPLAAPAAIPPQVRSYWVVERRLAGGAYPYHADATAGDVLLGSLIDRGITAFVDLTQAGTPGTPDADLPGYRGSATMPSDIEVVRRPIGDLGVPTVEQAIGTLDIIDRLLGEGRTVYVHCWGGIGRTGLTVGTWLLRHRVATGETVFAVLDQLRVADRVAGRYPAPQTAEQRSFLRRFRE